MRQKNLFIFPSLMQPRPFIISNSIKVLSALLLMTIFNMNVYFALLPLSFFTFVLFKDSLVLGKRFIYGKSIIINDIRNFEITKKKTIKTPVHYLKYETLTDKDRFYFIGYDIMFYRPKKIRDLNYFFGIKNRFYFYFIKFIVYFYFLFGIYLYPIFLSIFYFIIKANVLKNYNIFMILLFISFIYLLMMHLIEKIFKLEYYFPNSEGKFR